jgi:hypothetical protein
MENAMTKDAAKVMPQKSISDFPEEEQLKMAIAASLSQPKTLSSELPESSGDDDDDDDDDSNGDDGEQDSEEQQALPPSEKRQKVAVVVDTVDEESRCDGDCVLQIRQTNGATIIGHFRAMDSLQAVRTFVDSARTDGAVPYDLYTTYPRKKLVGEQTLRQLGLAPRSVVILERRR